jgi:hypothetical protein
MPQLMNISSYASQLKEHCLDDLGLKSHYAFIEILVKTSLYLNYFKPQEFLNDTELIHTEALLQVLASHPSLPRKYDDPRIHHATNFLQFKEPDPNHGNCLPAPD